MDHMGSLGIPYPTQRRRSLPRINLTNNMVEGRYLLLIKVGSEEMIYSFTLNKSIVKIS